MSNQQKLFGGIDFINAMNVQADQFMSLALESSLFDNARFCTVTAYKYDCVVSFRWGEKLEGKNAKLVIGSCHTISVDSGFKERYSNEEIEELKDIAKALGWEFEGVGR